MAQPSRTTVTIDGNSFNAISTNFGISTVHDNTGMPMMGAVSCAVDVHVDANDNVNLPFATLRSLFDLANIPTRDKIKDIKIEFWVDDSRTDVICSCAFRGWISHFNIGSSSGSNHLLTMSLQPALTSDHFHKIEMSN